MELIASELAAEELTGEEQTKIATLRGQTKITTLRERSRRPWPKRAVANKRRRPVRGCMLYVAVNAPTYVRFDLRAGVIREDPYVVVQTQTAARTWSLLGGNDETSV